MSQRVSLVNRLVGLTAVDVGKQLIYPLPNQIFSVLIKLLIVGILCLSEELVVYLCLRLLDIGGPLALLILKFCNII